MTKQSKLKMDCRVDYSLLAITLMLLIKRQGVKMDNQPVFSKLISYESLNIAFAKVLHNGGGAGGDGISLMSFAENAPKRLMQLSQELETQLYQTGPLRRFSVPKKSGGTRPLAIPCIIDRVVQTTLAIALTPLFEAEFEDTSYGYRPNRSVKQAVERVAFLRRQGFHYVVDGDIKSFFDEVPHDKLLNRLKNHVNDKNIIILLEKTLASFSPLKGLAQKGLAQGSPLSPLLSNLYLDSIDEAMEDTHIRIIRFADDFVVLTKTEQHAENALLKIAALLKEHGLELNPHKTKIVVFEEALKFLGHLFVGSVTMKSDEDEEIVPFETSAPLMRSVEIPLPSLAIGIAPLYVLEEGRVIEANHEAFVVSEAGRNLLSLPANLVGRIDVGAKAAITYEAQQLALAHDIVVSFLDGYGQTSGILAAPQQWNGQLHLAQARLSLDEKASLHHAKILVAGRIKNCHALLKRLNARRKNKKIAAFADKLFDIRKQSAIAASLNQLRGYEGQAGAIYWQAVDLCFLHGFELTKRIRREGADPINLVLDWLSSLLIRDVRAAALRAGLHTGFGTLHAARERGEACLYDMIEEFRAPLLEGLTLYIFNNRLVSEFDFYHENERLRVGKEAATRIIRAYEMWLSRAIINPKTGKKITWRALIHAQALEYKASLENCVDYQPYAMDF
jgi:CRISP-associated protein Cas1